MSMWGQPPSAVQKLRSVTSPIREIKEKECKLKPHRDSTLGGQELKIQNSRILIVICLFSWACLSLAPAAAQMFSFSKQELTDYTAQNPFGRFPDGRPKVPDDLIERARGLSSEEVWEVLQNKQFNNQYADGFQVLHP